MNLVEFALPFALSGQPTARVESLSSSTTSGCHLHVSQEICSAVAGTECLPQFPLPWDGLSCQV